MPKVSAQKRTKATPKAKEAKKTKTRKASTGRAPQVYTKLKELLKEEKDRINVYAVILGCSAPYYHEDIKRYMCTMKLVDDTLNPEDAAKGKPSFMSLSVFANTKDGIPQPAKVGTIIRVHRGKTKKKGKEIKFNCDVDVKSAWALFDNEEGVTATHHTGKTYTFTEEDKKLLKDARKFGEKFFKTYNLEAASAADQKGEEIDILCQALGPEKKKDKLTLFHDGKDFVKVAGAKGVKALDVIYVRAASKKGDHYVLNEYSSLLAVPKEYKSAADLLKKIEKAKKDKEVKKEFERYSA